MFKWNYPKKRKKVLAFLWKAFYQSGSDEDTQLISMDNVREGDNKL